MALVRKPENHLSTKTYITNKTPRRFENAGGLGQHNPSNKNTPIIWKAKNASFHQNLRHA